MSGNEESERLFQYFYYLGIDTPTLERRLSSGSLFRGAVFGLPRVNKTLTQEFQPISQQEIRLQVEAYSSYVKGFSKEQAKRWPLAYVVLAQERSYDLSNLDRWYVRDGGELVGNSIVYRVRLRP